MPTIFEQPKVTYKKVKCALDGYTDKFTGIINHAGQSDLDAIVDAIVATRTYLDAPTVKMIIAQLASEVLYDVGSSLRTINTGYLVFEPAVTGSVPAFDSALDPDVNRLYINIRTGDRIRKGVAQITPAKSDEEAAVCYIDHVEDSGTGEYYVISGTSDFVVTGLNISASREGESLTLVKNGETVATATIKGEDGMGQRIEAAFATAPAAGEYKLVLTSRGYSTPTGEAMTYSRNVTVK